MNLPFLNPPTPAWTVFIPWAWTKTDIYSFHPPHLGHVVIEWPLTRLMQVNQALLRGTEKMKPGKPRDLPSFWSTCASHVYNTPHFSFDNHCIQIFKVSRVNQIIYQGKGQGRIFSSNPLIFCWGLPIIREIVRINHHESYCCAT